MTTSCIWCGGREDMHMPEDGHLFESNGLDMYYHPSGAPPRWIEREYPQPMRSIYVIGSMRNPRILDVAKALRAIEWDAYEDWHSSGPESDDYWQAYEKARGRTFRESLAGYHATNVFDLDKYHLDRCGAALLVAPAGKSAHIELGYTVGRGKPAYILLDGEPERSDIMYKFATAIFTSLDEMLEALK